MTDQTNQWKLGLFIVVGFLLLLGTLFWLGLGALNRPKIVLTTHLGESVQGLSVGSAVNFRGLKVGEVTRILAANEGQYLLVYSDVFLDILQDLQVVTDMKEVRSRDFTPNNRIQLASSGITGLRRLEIAPWKPDDGESAPTSLAEALPPGASVPQDSDLYIKSELSAMQSIEDAVTSFMKKLESVGPKTEETFERIKEAVEDFADARLGDRGAEMLDAITTKANAIDAVALNDKAANLLTELESTSATFREIGEDFRDGKGTFAELDEAFAKLTNGLEDLITDVDGLVVQFDGAIRDAQIKKASDSLQSAANSIAGAGDSVSQTSDELTLLTQDFRRTMSVLQQSTLTLQSVIRSIERNPGGLLFGRPQGTPPPTPAGNNP